MATLFHTTCYDKWWRRLLRMVRGRPYDRLPKMIYVSNTPDIDSLCGTQTYKCDTCGSAIHIDTNWLDEYGGFVGHSIEELSWRRKERVEALAHLLNMRGC